MFVDNKIPACTGNNGGTVTALTSGGAGKTLTLTVTAQIAAGAHTFTCTNGGVGAIAANPTTPAITFTMVTTQDTTTSGVATYTTRAASAATFTSAATSNELVQGLTPTNIKFTFTTTKCLIRPALVPLTSPTRSLSRQPPPTRCLWTTKSRHARAIMVER